MTTAALARVSVSTASFYHLPLATALGLIRDAGMDGAEVVGHPETLLRGPAGTARVVARSGLPALTFHPPLYPFPGWPRGGRGMLLAVTLARALGAAVAVIHAPRARRLDSPRVQRFTAGLRAARALAAEHGVAIGFETTQSPWNGAPPRHFDDLDRFLRYATDLDLAVTLDTCHAGASGHDLVADLDQIGPRLRNIHYCDWRDAPAGVKPATHLLPGAAHADALAAFTRRLGATGYDGIITLEIAPSAVGYLPTRQVVQRLAAARAFILTALTEGAAQPATRA